MSNNQHARRSTQRVAVTVTAIPYRSHLFAPQAPTVYVTQKLATRGYYTNITMLFRVAHQCAKAQIRVSSMGCSPLTDDKKCTGHHHHLHIYMHPSAICRPLTTESTSARSEPGMVSCPKDKKEPSRTATISTPFGQSRNKHNLAKRVRIRPSMSIRVKNAVVATPSGHNGTASFNRILQVGCTPPLGTFSTNVGTRHGDNSSVSDWTQDLDKIAMDSVFLVIIKRDWDGFLFRSKKNGDEYVVYADSGIIKLQKVKSKGIPYDAKQEIYPMERNDMLMINGPARAKLDAKALLTEFDELGMQTVMKDKDMEDEYINILMTVM